MLAGWFADRGFLVPGCGAPHLRQAVASPSRTGRNQLREPLSSCLHVGPRRDCGPKRGKAAAAPVLLPQNWTKHPRLSRSGVTVGQKRLYLTRMAHNDENSPPECGAKWDKVPHPRWCCRAIDADDPQSGSNWAAGSGTQAHQNGKGSVMFRPATPGVESIIFPISAISGRWRYRSLSRQQFDACEFAPFLPFLASMRCRAFSDARIPYPGGNTSHGRRAPARACTCLRQDNSAKIAGTLSLAGSGGPAW